MKRLSMLLIFMFWTSVIYPQNDLNDLLDKLSDLTDIDFTTATFKSTRIMNGHSVERMAPVVLDFRILLLFQSGIIYEFRGL